MGPAQTVVHRQGVQVSLAQSATTGREHHAELGSGLLVAAGHAQGGAQAQAQVLPALGRGHVLDRPLVVGDGRVHAATAPVADGQTRAGLDGVLVGRAELALPLTEQGLPLAGGVRGTTGVLEGPGQVLPDDLGPGVVVAVDRHRLAQGQLELLHGRLAAPHLRVLGREVVARGDGVRVLGAQTLDQGLESALQGGRAHARSGHTRAGGPGAGPCALGQGGGDRGGDARHGCRHLLGDGRGRFLDMVHVSGQGGLGRLDLGGTRQPGPA